MTVIGRGLIGAAVAGAVALTAACATTTDGTGTLANGGRSSSASFPSTSQAPPTISPPTTSAPTSTTPAPPTTSSPPPSTHSTPPPPPASLSSLLEPAPAGSHPWTDSWGKLDSPTLKQYVARFYKVGYQKQAVSLLRKQGLVEIVHRTWIAASGDQMDLILLRFDTYTGALEHFLADQRLETSRTGVVPFQVGRYTSIEARGYRVRAADSQGYADGRVYANPGSTKLVLEGFYFGKHGFNRTTMGGWAIPQIARMSQ